MAICVRYWANYVNETIKLSRKSGNAVECDKMLTFIYDTDLRQ